LVNTADTEPDADHRWPLGCEMSEVATGVDGEWCFSRQYRIQVESTVCEQVTLGSNQHDGLHDEAGKAYTERNHRNRFSAAPRTLSTAGGAWVVGHECDRGRRVPW
jgi:hypothetical protein